MTDKIAVSQQKSAKITNSHSNMMHDGQISAPQLVKKVPHNSA